MEIYEEVRLEGANRKISSKALIDTGAQVSLMPLSVAKELGVWLTGDSRFIEDVNGGIKKMDVCVANIYFPRINNIGGQFMFMISDVANNTIIGMDIMKPLGISIDTKTNKVFVKNEIWEAFKVLAAVGVIAVGVVKIVKILSKEK